jgi:hypothetical protein
MLKLKDLERRYGQSFTPSAFRMNEESRVSMFVPQPPALTPLKHITPSIYEASTGCLAKAAWYAQGERSVLPEHPAAILGTSFHAVLAAAHRRGLTTEAGFDRVSARQLFHGTARKLHNRAHPLIKLKFPMPERLPFYNLHRERAVLIAARIASEQPSPVSSGGRATAARAPRTEAPLKSTDGLIVGRPDHVDGERHAVVDYKSGHVPECEAEAISSAEARQLRLYAYLALQAGIPVSKGMIIRGNGRYCELPIPPDEAEEEACRAKDRLLELNVAVNAGAAFRDLASPSPQHCRSCPCIPFCDAFWEHAAQDGEGECGCYVEGKVLETASRSILGVVLTTLLIEVEAGTVSVAQASVEQIPTEWLRVAGGTVPGPGDVIRVVQGRSRRTTESSAVIRVDKTTTSVWRLGFENKLLEA